MYIIYYKRSYLSELRSQSSVDMSDSIRHTKIAVKPAEPAYSSMEMPTTDGWDHHLHDDESSSTSESSKQADPGTCVSTICYIWL